MNYEEYEDSFFEGLDHGEPKCRGIRNAIDKALELQDYENVLTLYGVFIEEDTFYCDGFQSVIIFPEYQSVFEQHPEFHEKNKYTLMWSFKWIAGSAEDFYQVTFEQLEDMYRQYGEYCDRFKYNKRSYYRKIWNFMDTYAIKNFSLCSSCEEAHKLMMHCQLDELSEPAAGEADDLTSYYLFVEKDVQKALKAAGPIFSGRLICNVVPHYTYANFADYYFNHKDIVTAADYAMKSLRIINRDFGTDKSMMKYKGMIISVLAFYDMPTALKFFRKQLNVCYTNECGLEMFYFYRGAYHLFLNLERTEQKQVRLIFPFKEDPLYKKSNVYSVTKLRDFFYNKTKYIADRFDERDNNHHFNYLLDKKYSFEDAAALS